MKFTIERDTFTDAVSWVARALPARPVIPISAAIRLTVTDGILSLAAFDYETSAQADVAAAGDHPGMVLIPGRLLAEITRSLPSHPVEMTADDVTATLACGSSRFTLPAMPAAEYPDLPGMPPAAGTAAADLLAAAIGQVAFAADRNDTLPVLTGIHMKIAGDMVTLAATNRYRLAVRELKWEPAREGLETAAIIPARVLADAAKSFTGAAAQVTVSLDEETGTGMAGWQAGQWQATTRLLGGKFPRYEALLPAEFTAAAELAAIPFAEAVKRVALVVGNNTPIRLSFTAGELTLEAGTGGEAEASETMAAVLSGGSVQAMFRPQYLLDGLAAIDSSTARLSFTTPGKPVMLTGKYGEGENLDYRYVLMPARPAGPEQGKGI